MVFEDRRKSQRFSLERAVELMSMDAKPKQLGGGRLLNMSTVGALVESSAHLEPGMRVKAIFALDAKYGFWMASEVAHSDPSGSRFRIGLKFLKATMLDKEKIRAYFQRQKRKAAEREGFYS